MHVLPLHISSTGSLLRGDAAGIVGPARLTLVRLAVYVLNLGVVHGGSLGCTIHMVAQLQPVILSDLSLC